MWLGVRGFAHRLNVGIVVPHLEFDMMKFEHVKLCFFFSLGREHRSPLLENMKVSGFTIYITLYYIIISLHCVTLGRQRRNPEYVQK